MTAVAFDRPPAVRRPVLVAVAVFAGFALIAGRPWLFRGPQRELQMIVAFAVMGAIGAWWPMSDHRRVNRSRRVAVIMLGVAAFALGRVLGGGTAPLPHGPHYLVVGVFSAVAEEAFFRRLLFGGLEHRGETVAVLGSAVAFALVHYTIYGGWAMPLDMAAGLLLSWQRAACGSWRVPALTHAIGNVLVLL